MMYQFIVGPLVKEHGLDDSETDKPLLNVEDFLEVLHCHWVTDTNSFPHQRQRAQIATLLLLAAVTGDFDLFVLRDKKIGEIALTLQPNHDRSESDREVEPSP